MNGLRIGDVMRKLGLKKPTIYAMVKNGKFPRPVKIGRASLWLEDEVEAVLQASKEKRNQKMNGGQNDL